MVEFEDLSPFSQMLFKSGNDKTTIHTPKLIADLHDKQNYGCHWSYLHDGISCGLKIKKIHYILKFRQKAYCRKYIEKCVAARSMAQNSFEKDLYKLAQNAL